MWIKFLLLSVPSLVTGPCEVKRHWLTNHPFFSLFLEVKLMITFSNVMEMLPFLELWLYVYLQTQNVSNIFHQWKKNTNIIQTSSEHIQFSSVAQSCPTLCDPMNHSTPGLPVHHQLPEFTQTHVHRVGDAIHPLSSPSPPAPNPPSIRVFSNESTLRMRRPKYWSWMPRADLLQNGLVGSPCSPRDSQESSPTPQFKSISFSVLSLLHSPTLTSIHDHWKNHSLD